MPDVSSSATRHGGAGHEAHPRTPGAARELGAVAATLPSAQIHAELGQCLPIQSALASTKTTPRIEFEGKWIRNVDDPSRDQLYGLATNRATRHVSSRDMRCGLRRRNDAPEGGATPPT